MKAFYLTIFVLLSVCVYSQSTKEAKLYKIKSKTITKTVENNGVPSTYKETVEEFDKNGRTISKTEYSKSGTVKSTDTYKYDNFGNEIEHVETDTKDGKTVKTVTTYDANGNKVTETTMDGSGNIMDKITYKYDSKGLRTEKKEFDASGKLKNIRNSTYEYY